MGRQRRLPRALDTTTTGITILLLASTILLTSSSVHGFAVPQSSKFSPMLQQTERPSQTLFAQNPHPRRFISSHQQLLTTVLRNLGHQPTTLNNGNDSQRQRQLIPAVTPLRYYSIGFFGHSSLLLLSTLLVMIAKQVFFSTGDSSEEQAGIMDRCPWPFIFFHDPKQGMKDSGTWVLITWFALWRILKAVPVAR